MSMFEAYLNKVKYIKESTQFEIDPNDPKGEVNGTINDIEITTLDPRLKDEKIGTLTKTAILAKIIQKDNIPLHNAIVKKYMDTFKPGQEIISSDILAAYGALIGGDNYFDIQSKDDVNFKVIPDSEKAKQATIQRVKEAKEKNQGISREELRNIEKEKIRQGIK